MKRIFCFCLLFLFCFYAPVHATSVVDQIPARPALNEDYYCYHALFYNAHLKTYFLIFSTEPVKVSSANKVLLNGFSVIYYWNPIRDEQWLSKTSLGLYDSNYGGYYMIHLSGNYDLLKSDGTTLASAADDIVFYEHARTNFGVDPGLWESHDEEDGTGGFDVSGILSGLGRLLDAILSLPGKIGTKILEILKSLFLPSEGFLDSKINYLVDRFTVAFGITSFDMSTLFYTEKALEDITVTMYGATVKIVDMSYVIDALAIFRRVIRGFISLLLIFYNINQLLALIGVAPVTLGALIGINDWKDSRTIHPDRVEDKHDY